MREREGRSEPARKKKTISIKVCYWTLEYIALYYIIDEENAKTPCHFNFKTLFFILILLLFVVKWILHRTNNTYLFHYGIFDDCRFDVRAFFILARYFLSTTIWILLFLLFFLRSVLLFAFLCVVSVVRLRWWHKMRRNGQLKGIDANEYDRIENGSFEIFTFRESI